ncbi:MAG: type IV conjugative transfer system coupling protein TraD [Legionellaceae bacterium]|nr:type IV conjugative transfer system coupling protein TraD [Legionellaceae bacterium]
MSHESNHKHFTRGGQIAFHNLRMLFQINKALLNVHCISWVVICVLCGWYFIPKDLLIQTADYEAATVLKLVGKERVFNIPYAGGVLKQSVHALTTHPYYPKIAAMCLTRLIQCAWMALGASVAMAVILSWYFVKKGKFQSQNQFVRGSQLAELSLVKRQIIKNGMQSDIAIDGFPLIKDSEVQHLLVHGTVGTGKSQLMMKILDALRKRGDRVIVYDKGCALIPHYFNKTRDVILNPFDARCATWDLWAEAPRDTDLENMAESLIPMQGESDPFWTNAARTVFVSVVSKMRHEKDRSLERMLHLLLNSDFSELEHYLAGTPAATLMSSKIEKTAVSIRSVIATYLKSLQALLGLENTPFSIRDYLLNEHQSGWLFISSNGEQHKSLKPLMSMWLAMGSLTMLSLTPDPKRRIWFLCDELPSLHKLPLLGETIAEVRKFGGCFLLGMQSFSQLEKVYGRSGAAEIFDLLNTRFFFRSPSSDMARLVSRELGEEDLDESRENYSYGANSVRDGISLSNQRVSRPIVSYPEVSELPNLSCFVRLPGQYPVTKLTLQHQQRTVIADALIIRPQEIAAISNSPHQNEEKIDHSQFMQKAPIQQKEWVNEYLD